MSGGGDDVWRARIYSGRARRGGRACAGVRVRTKDEKGAGSTSVCVTPINKHIPPEIKGLRLPVLLGRDPHSAPRRRHGVRMRRGAGRRREGELQRGDDDWDYGAISRGSARLNKMMLDHGHVLDLGGEFLARLAHVTPKIEGRRPALHPGRGVSVHPTAKHRMRLVRTTTSRSGRAGTGGGSGYRAGCAVRGAAPRPCDCLAAGAPTRC